MGAAVEPERPELIDNSISPCTHFVKLIMNDDIRKKIEHILRTAQPLDDSAMRRIKRLERKK